jgi:hypothetical protein
MAAVCDDWGHVMVRCVVMCGGVAQVSNEDLVKAWCRKMAPPLVTLLGAAPEVQYVALRNINLIVQKRPAILANEVKVGAGCGAAQCIQVNPLRMVQSVVLCSMQTLVFCSNCCAFRCSSASIMTPSMSRWKSWRS